MHAADETAACIAGSVNADGMILRRIFVSERLSSGVQSVYKDFRKMIKGEGMLSLIR